LKEFLEKGYIQRSINSTGTFIFFIPKKNRDLRIYVNYREFNKIIKKTDTFFLYKRNAEPTLKKIIFTKLNIRDAYYRIKIIKKPNKKQLSALVIITLNI